MVSETGSKNGPLDPVSIGSLIGDRYRIDSLIDEGAMGRVFRGEHVHMKKRVAIKVLRPELTRVPEVLQRFEREAMAAAHIEHQHVASARDFGKLPDGSVYLVLEYVEGITLRKELKRGRFDTTRALRIGRQIALALSAAHELDIVHRDLKPENVMLLERAGARDFVKVLDFGVAKVPIDMAQNGDVASTRKSDDSLITKAGMVFGTPDYMAPEQALGQPVDARADLYSLGVMLFEMIAGVRPFKADHELGILGQQLSSGPPTFSQRNPELRIDPEIEKTVHSLLTREASQRPSNAAAVIARLDAHLLALGEIPEPVSAMRDRLPSARDSGELKTLARPPGALPDAPPHALSERVKAALPKPLQAIPNWGVALMPLLLLAVFAIVVIEFRSPESPHLPGVPTSESTVAATASAQVVAPERTVPAMPPAKLTDFQVEAALEAGDLAVGALLERYPDDPRAHLADARVAKKLGDPKRAVAATKRALAQDPKTRENPHLAAVLWWAVQKPDTQQSALALLEGPMKSQGADIIYDLAITEGIRPPLSDTARNWLRTRAFERESTKEAAVAAALLLAPSCDIRKALTKRAENVGDERAAKLLRSFRDGKGCQAGEKAPCNSCLDDKAVNTALDAIAARTTHAARGK